MTDIQFLIKQWRDGDQHSAEKLYELHHIKVYRLAYGLLGNAEDAEEAAQDALTYALVNVNKYDENKAKFSTWLHTITVSRVRDRQRRKKFQLFSLSSWMDSGGDVASKDATPEQAHNVLDIQTVVWEAMEKLQPPLREALVLRYWGGYTFKEMATILNCPMGTTQSRVRRGFEKLREHLSAEDIQQLVGSE